MSAARIGLLAALLTAAGWLLWHWLPGEEGRIARRLRALSAEASLPGGEDRLVRAARAGRIGGYFTQDVTIDLGAPFPPLSGRDRIVGFVATAPVPEEGLRAELVDLQVRLGPDEATATASTTARVSGVRGSPGGAAGEVRELELGLVRRDGEWLVDRVQVVRALESPLQ